MASDDSHGSLDLVRTTFGTAVTIWGQRIAPALVAPLGILLTIPLLVGGVGLVIWWQGRRALVESVDTMASAQFGDRAEQVAKHADDVLRHADPLTDNMVAYVTRVGIDPPLEEFALTFRDQLRACPGVAYISFGTHEGNYFGVYVDSDGSYVLTHRIYGGPQQTHKRDYRIGDGGSLTLFNDDPAHGFDPRARPWYQATVRKGHRNWSDPYVWFDIGVPGITCSEPIQDAAGKLLAVTTVDFHLNGLSEFVEGLGTQEGGRTFVFTEAMEVVAFPGARQEFGQGEAEGRIVRVEDLDDPVVEALFAAVPPFDDDAARQFRFEARGEPYLAALRPVQIGRDTRWFVATFGPLAPLTASGEAHARTALYVSGAALLVAILVAAFFARFIVRSHLLVRRAEHRAKAADERARQLGSYRMTRKLDEGGMGEVWIAEHEMLARPAAIKLIRGKFLESKTDAEREAAIERFRREARTIASLRSRHTIGIYDFGVADDGALFYVMELLDGIDLHVLVKEHGTVPPRRAIDVLIQMASSLAEAHANGVVHRDIKPANVFLCRQADEVDIVKVLDFGMARQTDGTDPALTTTGAISGTPAFMAPEQIRDVRDLDGRVDVYALGCVAYWLLAGRYVFQGESAMEIVMAHVTDEPEPLGIVAQCRVPPALEKLVMRCLTKDRDRRPASMSELAAELESILESLPDDEWTTSARRAWWEAVPSRFDEPVEGGDAAVRLSPKRGV